MLVLNLCAAWIGILLGLLSGAIQGLFFHRERWLGGYASWPRRMLRLGHVSFFGIAFLNLAFANTMYLLGQEPPTPLPTLLLIAAAVLMPSICYLSAWHKPLRRLFVLPVLSLFAAVIALIAGGLSL